MKDVVLVMGASVNTERYSNKAIKLLRKNQKNVVAFGLNEGIIDDVEIFNKLIKYDDIHTVSLYLSPKNQPSYYNYILSLEPKRVIFNPGTENADFSKILNEKNIKVEENYTLVMLNFGIF